MSGALRLFNRQRARPVNLRLLRWIIRDLLADFLGLDEFDLTIHLIGKTKMIRLNETHLKHAGSTDVITFDYSDDRLQGPLAGEIFVCVDEALLQARRFRAHWTSELVRYIVHGVLHLRGHDDLRPAARRRMKREETRLLKKLDRRFRLSKLERKTRMPA